MAEGLTSQEFLNQNMLEVWDKLRGVHADHQRRVAESDSLASFQARRIGEDAHNAYSGLQSYREALIAQRTVEVAYRLLPQVEAMNLSSREDLELVLDQDLDISQEVAFGAVSFVASANDREFDLTWNGIKFTIEPDQTMEEIQANFGNLEHVRRVGQISLQPPRS